MHTHLLALGALAAASTLWLSSPAHACGAPACSNPTSPVADATLPSGITAIPLDPTSKVVDEAGNEVPFTLVEEAPFVSARFAAPLADGAYEIRTPDRCTGAAYVPSGRVLRQPFSVGAAGATPTTLGSLALSKVERQPAYQVENDCGASTPEVAVGYLSFQPSADLTPYLRVARLWVTVDGALWAAEGFGGTSGGWTGEPASTQYGYSRSIRTVAAACGDPPATPAGFRAIPRSDFLTPGRHVVELHGKLAGASSELPPLRVEVDVSCDAPMAGEEAGCSAAPHAPRSPGAAAGALALLVALAVCRGRVGFSRRRRT